MNWTTSPSQRDSGILDRLSDAEFERRHAALQLLMAQNEFDAVVVFGTHQGWQNVFYLSNHWDLVSCYLLFPAQSDPVLLTGVFPHLASARANAIIEDIRFGGPDSIGPLSGLLAERGLSIGRVGLIEPNSYRLPGIPYKDMLRLRELNRKTEFVPCTAMFEGLRRVKSPEEMDVLWRCGVLSDDCLARVVDAVRPGISERDLAQVIAGAPGDTVAVLVGSTAMTAPQVPAPAIRPMARELREGDVVLIELSKGFAGYAGQVHGMVTVGPATDRYMELVQLANDAYRAIVKVLRTGCSPHEVAAAAAAIGKAGLTIANPLVHGFGMGIEPGLHVGMPGSDAYWPAADFTFPEGATVTIEPNPCDRAMRMGATAGGLVHITEGGCEELQRFAGHDLIQKLV